ncbi:MAG: methyl-accepting chemotaxis protein [Burkholderiaceae bacterium]|nr:methyl-accepting chemotaxis protein [Burkholderiaceae bacterium]
MVIATMAIVSIGITAYSSWGLDILSNATDEIDLTAGEMKYGARLNQSVVELNRAEYRIAANPAELADVLKAIETAKTELAERLEKVKKTAGPDQMRLLGTVEQRYRDYLTQLDDTIKVAKKYEDTQISEGQEMILKSVQSSRVAAGALREAAAEYVEFTDKKGTEFSEGASRTAEEVSRNLIIFAVIGIFVGVAIGFFIGRTGIVLPTARMQATIQEIEKTGNLTLRIPVLGKDEVAKTGIAINTFLTTLENAFHEINDVATQVGQSAEQVNSASQNLAATSEEQSSAVEEVTSSVEETDSQVKANTDAANAANQLVLGTSSAASDGQGKMGEMVSSMNGINSSAEDIGKIIKVIDEIAFQTNLLALNAAVEAARAGQHGRGFAVVAQEVRNLAGRSAKAARETADLIENSIKQVGSGVAIAGRTSEALDQIVGNVVKVKDLVAEIAAASTEQSRGVAQINVAINQVAKAAQESSQQAEELASTAEEMTAATERMLQEIRRFKLSDRRGMAGGNGALSSDMVAQIKEMMGQSNGHTYTDAQKTVDAIVEKIPGSKKKAPKTVLPLDHDERGFATF